jgi:hypothetical protein
MGEMRLDYRLETALTQLIQQFRANESTALIASDFLILPGILDHLKPGTKLGRVLDLAERSINEQGFDFWQPPETVARMIEVLRAAIAPATDAEAKALLLSLLRDNDPACIASVPLG